jgi:hypothetical protein
MNFESQVQQWVAIDDQLHKLNEQTRQLRIKRAALTNTIIKQATTSSVKISDGHLKFVNTRVPEHLTFKYLQKTLAGIIQNENQVKLILEHIKTNREFTVVPEIKRF